jgi:Fic family protein
MEEFSAESLKLKPEHLKNLKPVEKPIARKRQTREFVQITREQSERLDKTKNATTYKVFHHLLFLNWKSPGRTIRLANEVLAKKGIDRHAKRRALSELKKLGLIKLKMRPRKSPEIVVR